MKSTSSTKGEIRAVPASTESFVQQRCAAPVCWSAGRKGTQLGAIRHPGAVLSGGGGGGGGGAASSQLAHCPGLKGQFHLGRSRRWTHDPAISWGIMPGLTPLPPPPPPPAPPPPYPPATTLPSRPAPRCHATLNNAMQGPRPADPAIRPSPAPAREMHD